LGGRKGWGISKKEGSLKKKIISIKSKNRGSGTADFTGRREKNGRQKKKNLRWGGANLERRGVRSFAWGGGTGGEVKTYGEWEEKSSKTQSREQQFGRTKKDEKDRGN